MLITQVDPAELAIQLSFADATIEHERLGVLCDHLADLGHFYIVTPDFANSFRIQAVVPTVDPNYLRALLEGFADKVPEFNCDLAIVKNLATLDKLVVEFSAYCTRKGGTNAIREYSYLAYDFLSKQAGVTPTLAEDSVLISSFEAGAADGEVLAQVRQRAKAAGLACAEVGHLTPVLSLLYFADEDMGL